MSHLTVELADVGPRHQTLPELFGSVPHQVQAGLLEEEGQEAQVAVQILDTRGREASKLIYCVYNHIAPTINSDDSHLYELQSEFFPTVKPPNGKYN